MMRLILLGLVFLSILPSMGDAHDLWLVPEADPSAGRPVQVLLSQGMNFPESESAADPEKLASKFAVAPDGQRIEVLSLGQRGNSGVMAFATKQLGTYAIGAETTAKVANLEAEAFNAYLVSDGMPQVFLDRVAAKTTHESAREQYIKSPKALVRVGDSPAGDPTKPLGLTLEIVPLKNPFTLTIGETLPVQVLFQGQPLADAPLGWDLPADGPTLTGMVKTDAHGRALIPISQTGLITLRLTHMTHPRTGDFEWASFWTSLTFHIDQSVVESLTP